MNYRERCYNTFVSTHWQYCHGFTGAHYDFQAKVYSKRYGAFLPRDKNAEILDVACGAGHFLYYLGGEGYVNCRGIDISAEQVEVAQNNGIRNVEAAELFGYLAVNQGRFDMIAAFDIIEHFTKDEVLNFLDAVFNALKPGGSVIVGTLNASSLMGAGTVFIDFTHETGFTPESLSQVMRVCGFDVNVYGEKPAAHDLRSAVRALLWSVMKRIMRLYIVIERGQGRGLFKADAVLEPRMFAVGIKGGE